MEVYKFRSFYTQKQLESENQILMLDTRRTINGNLFNEQIYADPEYIPKLVVQKENVNNDRVMTFLSRRLRKEITDPSQIAIAIHLLEIPDALLQYVPSSILKSNTKYNSVKTLSESSFADGKDARDLNAWCAAAYNLITPLQFEIYINYRENDTTLTYTNYHGQTLTFESNDQIFEKYMPIGYKDFQNREVEWSYEDLFSQTAKFVLATRIDDNYNVMRKSLACNLFERTRVLILQRIIPKEAADLLFFANDQNSVKL